MDYFLSVDGGGTKLNSLLFNSNYDLLSWSKSGAINPNFSDSNNIKESMKTCIQQCMQAYPDISLEGVYISMPGPRDLYISLLKETTQVNEVIRLPEGKMSLLAGIQQEEGMVALAGTGSRVDAYYKDQQFHIGGWGAIFDDEGSGFSIGRAGLSSAVKSFDGRGPKTLIETLLIKHWNLERMRQLYQLVYRSPSWRVTVASAAPIVAEAAREQDEIAKQILIDAGTDIAIQVEALRKKMDLIPELKLLVSGGAWKGCQLMFQSFQQRLHLSFPKQKIHLPMFEPVMGGVTLAALTHNPGKFCQTLEKIKQDFAIFSYKTNWRENSSDHKTIFPSH